jgi:hypothetical protein
MSETRGETFVMKGDPERGPIDFSSFLLGLASSVLIHLGLSPHPETGATQPNLLLARQSLDVLSMLREKTRGNLTGDEERFFENLLTDLRFRFVEATQR